MKNSKKIFLLTIIVVAIVAFAVSAALAEEKTLDLTTKLGAVGKQAGFNSPNTLPQIIGSVTKGFLSLLGVIFMGYIVYAGSLWLNARGEEEKITKAKAIIRGSIIGLIIVFVAYAITGFVITRISDTTGYKAS